MANDGRRAGAGEAALIGLDAASRQELARELLELAAEQRETVHLGVSEDVAERLVWREVTVRHADRLAAIMADVGWPAEDVVGAEAARAAWLVAQHADHQLDVQRRAFDLMSSAVEAGRASRYQLAFLYDRMLVNSGRPQVYGTQIADVRDGEPVPWPCVDVEHLDDRRAEVGIPPFAEYVAAHRN
jgi:hypothetical protein